MRIDKLVTTNLPCVKNTLKISRGELKKESSELINSYFQTYFKIVMKESIEPSNMPMKI